MAMVPLIPARRDPPVFRIGLNAKKQHWQEAAIGIYANLFDATISAIILLVREVLP